VRFVIGAFDKHRKIEIACYDEKRLWGGSIERGGG